MDKGYIGYCMNFLSKKENEANYKRYGFEQLYDLKDKHLWYRYIDNPLNNVTNNESGTDNTLSLYQVKKKSLIAVNPDRKSFDLHKTCPNKFQGRTKNDHYNTLKYIQILFDIDVTLNEYSNNPKKYKDASRIEANKNTYVSMTIEEALERDIQIEKIMDEIVILDMRNFDSDWSESSSFTAETWTNIYKVHNPEFIKFAFCNGILIGYFDFFLVSNLLYNDWKTGKYSTIKLLEEYNIINYTTTDCVDAYLYLDILCIDKTMISLTNNLENLIFRDLLRQLNKGLKIIFKNKFIVFLILDGKF